MPDKKILMVLGGDPPTEDLLSWYQQETDLSVAVDSGFQAFRQAGLSPDMLIGDLDSCGDFNTADFRNLKVKLIEIPDQEKTDFQKALSFIQSESSPEKIIILGALGKRTDHLINNFSILSAIPEKIEVVIDSAKEWIQRVNKNKPVIIKGRGGSTVSLIPQGDGTVVSSTGLKWDLNKDHLSMGGKISQSNVFESDFAEISVHSGNLLIIIQK